MLEPREPAGQPEQAAWPGLTVEALIYVALIVGAAFLRFYDLGRWPLLTGEATQALAAWRFLHGQPAGSGVVPLLFDGALAGFFAFGASDAVTRLLPALCGTALVALPLALRRRLGTWGALAATFMLAFSPALVYYSRTLAGAMPALAGLGALLAAAEWAAQRQVRAARIAGVAGLAVALTASPWTYTFLLAGLLFFGLGWLAQRRQSPWPGWSEAAETGQALLSARRAWGGLAILAALIPTALLLRPSGLQGLADLLATWLARLVPGSAGPFWGYPLGLLAFYEAGTLILGLAGVVIGLRRRSPWAGFLGLWALLAVLLATASGARDGEPVALAVLPLALLGGLAVDAIVARLRPANWAWMGGCLAVLSTLVGFWWLQLAGYSNPETQIATSSAAMLVWILVVATPPVIVGAGLVFWLWVGHPETTWAVTLLGLGLAGCLLLRNTVSLNLAFARDAREPLVVAPTSLDVRDMTAFLEDWSSRKALDQHALSVAVGEDLAPVVPWYLRDFTWLRLLPAPLADADAGAVISGRGPSDPSPAGYASQRYRLRTTAEPFGAGGHGLAWWLLRTAGGQVQAETCKLWVKP